MCIKYIYIYLIKYTGIIQINNLKEKEKNVSLSTNKSTITITSIIYV